MESAVLISQLNQRILQDTAAYDQLKEDFQYNLAILDEREALINDDERRIQLLEEQRRVETENWQHRVRQLQLLCTDQQRRLQDQESLLHETQTKLDNSLRAQQSSQAEFQQTVRALQVQVDQYAQAESDAHDSLRRHRVEFDDAMRESLRAEQETQNLIRRRCGEFEDQNQQLNVALRSETEARQQAEDLLRKRTQEFEHTVRELQNQLNSSTQSEQDAQQLLRRRDVECDATLHEMQQQVVAATRAEQEVRDQLRRCTQDYEERVHSLQIDVATGHEVSRRLADLEGRYEQLQIEHDELVVLQRQDSEMLRRRTTEFHEQENSLRAQLAVSTKSLEEAYEQLRRNAQESEAMQNRLSQLQRTEVDVDTAVRKRDLQSQEEKQALQAELFGIQEALRRRAQECTDKERALAAERDEAVGKQQHAEQRLKRRARDFEETMHEMHAQLQRQLQSNDDRHADRESQLMSQLERLQQNLTDCELKLESARRDAKIAHDDIEKQRIALTASFEQTLQARETAHEQAIAHLRADFDERMRKASVPKPSTPKRTHLTAVQDDDDEDMSMPSPVRMMSFANKLSVADSGNDEAVQERLRELLDENINLKAMMDRLKGTLAGMTNDLEAKIAAKEKEKQAAVEDVRVRTVLDANATINGIRSELCEQLQAAMDEINSLTRERAALLERSNALQGELVLLQSQTAVARARRGTVAGGTPAPAGAMNSQVPAGTSEAAASLQRRASLANRNTRTWLLQPRPTHDR
eukprot:TRINITY_DN10482_c0_g3_i1.p1 TRINITY_DN10482_c0_g3~~TRINITY_DN10482_c0_g3_i1.p1  ORF type:complete len:755 (+),score=190.47 TRINITY_DN10482_c0_g3_i1:53-2317(+)